MDVITMIGNTGTYLDSPFHGYADGGDLASESGGERPAHTLLLAAGIHVIEHLTGLDALPEPGARFTAAPPAIEGFGTFPVRAFAVVR